MKFIGRKNEMAKLGAEYKRDSSFVVIYGRRRVGKCGWKSQTRKNSQCIGAGNFRTDTVSVNTF